MIKYLSILSFLILLASCSGNRTDYVPKPGDDILINSGESVVDPIGANHRYPVLKQSYLLWMGINVMVPTRNAWCVDENVENCQAYGRLYHFGSAAMACRGLGSGWRIPDKSEWETLLEVYGGYEMDGKRYGPAPASAAKNLTYGVSGFNAVHAGVRNGEGQFVDYGKIGKYWVNETLPTGEALVVVFEKGKPEVRFETSTKHVGLSCRCVKTVGY